MVSYLTHKDRVIRKKAKRIYNKIHGAAEHLKIIAENSLNLLGENFTCNMENSDQLHAENELLRLQNADLKKIVERLTEQVSQLNANINQLINKNTVVPVNDVSRSNGESSNTNENNAVNMTVDTQSTNGNASSVNNQSHSFAEVLGINGVNIKTAEKANTNGSISSKKNVTPVVINVSTADEKNALLGLLRINFGDNVTIMGIGGTNIRAAANDMEGRSKLIEFLQQRGYEFHTYCPESERRVDIVVKGLPTMVVK